VRKSSIIKILVVLSVSLFIAFQVAQSFAQDEVIVVNQVHSLASDQNPGTAEMPVVTVSRGLELAVDPFLEGKSIKVVIHAGIYRENLEWEVSAINDGSLVIEATDDGEVIISGSEIWNNWEKINGTNTYSHSWRYKWLERSEKIKKSDLADEGKVKTLRWLKSVSPLFLLRAMVFVNGEHYQQVLTGDELVEGKIQVNEDEEKIYLSLPENINPDFAQIEVAVEPIVFKFQKSANITIRGIDFIHSNSIMKGGGLYFVTCQNILVENCGFYYNNWTGLKFSTCRDVTVKQCKMMDNGALGIAGFQLKNFILESCETARNNWRGYASGAMDWDLGGMKVLRVHNCQVINHYSHDNFTYGIWFDDDNIDISIKNSVFSDNWLDGIFIEKSQGPTTIDSCEIIGNKRSGITIGSSDNVIITNNVISNNKYQLFISSYGMQGHDFETGSEFHLKNQNCTILNNTIEVGTGERKFFYWLTQEQFQEFLSTLTTDIEY